MARTSLRIGPCWTGSINSAFSQSHSASRRTDIRSTRFMCRMRRSWLRSRADDQNHVPYLLLQLLPQPTHAIEVENKRAEILLVQFLIAVPGHSSSPDADSMRVYSG